MAVNLPPWKLRKSKRTSSNPGVLVIGNYKFHCAKSTKSKEDDGTIYHYYVCSERRLNGCLASANMTTVMQVIIMWVLARDNKMVGIVSENYTFVQPNTYSSKGPRNNL